MNTKRILALVLALCVVFSLALPGVSFADGEHTVTFNLNGGTGDFEITQTVANGETAVNPGEPSKEGDKFAFWGYDQKDEVTGQSYAVAYDFTEPVTTNLELNAYWASGYTETEVSALLANQDNSLKETKGESETPEKSAEELFREAIATGSVILSNNVVLTTENVEITQDTVLDLNGHSITSIEDDLFTVKSGTLTINDSVGGGSILTDSWTVLNAAGGNIVVNGGKIGAKNANTAYKTAGNIVFNGGMINQAATYYTVADGLKTYDGYGANKGYYFFAPETVTAVSPAAFELAVGNTQQLTATASEGITLSWSSSDTNVATVDASGKVTAVSNGSATIYAANAATGSYDTATVTIGDTAFKNTTTNKQYASLQVAVNEAQSNDTIQLMGDTTITTLVTFPEGKTLTLDLNGETLTESTNGVRLLKNEGALTITGTGTITNSADNSINTAYGLIDNYGTLVISNGTFYDYGQGGGAAFRNQNGTMTVKSGTVVEAFGEASGNATISSAATLIVEDGVQLKNHATDGIAGNGYGVYCVSIYGGNATIGTKNAETPTVVNGNRGAIGINGGALTINSGTFSSTLYRDLWITNDSTSTVVTINGGTFSGSKESILAAVDDGNQDMSDVAVTINGGYFNKNVSLGEKDSTNEWTFAIKGGYYKTLPSAALIASGYVVKPIEGDYSYVVERTPVAKINETTYPTLAAAIEAAGNNASTITLVDDATGDVTVAAGQNITLDLDGHNIVGAQHAITNNGTLVITDTKDSGCVYTTDLSAQGMAAVLNEATGTLKINAGWFGDSDNDKTNANGVQRGNAVRNWGTATLNGGHYTACDNFTNGGGYAYAIGTGGTGKNGSMTIENADVYGKMNGGIAADSGTLVVNGGSFVLTENNNYRALWITNDGGNTSVTVNGGTFIGKEAAVGASIDDNKQDSSDVAIVINGGAFAAAGNKPTVSVSKKNSKYEWTTQITGGIFKKAPASDYIVSGYEVVDNTDHETASAYPYAVQQHTHSYDYSKPNWSWKVVNGAWSATVSYPCTKGDASESVTVDVSDPVNVTEDEITYSVYTAVDNDVSHNEGKNEDTFKVVQTFTVTYNGSSEQHIYGYIATFGDSNDTKLYDWSVNGDLRAKGTSVFYLPVVANAEVTRTESATGTTTQEPVANSSASVTVDSQTNKGTVVYHVTWSLPDGAQITSEKIYRGTSTHGNTVGEEKVIQKGAQHIVDLNVRNGDYTYTVNNVTVGKDLHLVLEIKYTLPDVSGIQTLTDYKVVYVNSGN